MSLPRYSAYKATGTELMEIPAHWQLVRARSLGQFSSSGIDKKAVEGEQFVRMFNYLDVYRSKDKVLTYSDALMATTAVIDKAIEHAVRAGDILITPSSETPGDIGHAARVAEMPDGVVYSYHLVRYRPLVDVDAAYLVYLLNSAPTRRYFASVCTGTTRQVLVREDLKNTPVCLPPLPEQRSIAVFLDRETAKIDALIAEQEKLLALLAEKRQATISHAVTRGLDPNVPMKDSGIPWLGQVPAHWAVKPLKKVIASAKAGPFGSALTKDMYCASGYRVYGQEQVIPADFTLGDYFIDSEKYSELQQYAVAPGDILISCVGTFGKIAIVPEGIHPGVINPRLIRLRAGAHVSAEFLVAVLRSSIVFEQFSVLSRGGTMDVINVGTLSGIQIAAPPLDEQQIVCEFLVAECASIDRLRTEATRSASLLRERRGALIAAAVTGQIDVRGLVEP